MSFMQLSAPRLVFGIKVLIVEVRLSDDESTSIVIFIDGCFFCLVFLITTYVVFRCVSELA